MYWLPLSVVTLDRHSIVAGLASRAWGMCLGGPGVILSLVVRVMCLNL